MNWLQTIREHLNLSQEELAQYLAISVHMLQSVEQDRRQLPKESIKAAQEMYSAVKDAAARPLRIDPEPPTIEQIRRVGRLHRRYSRRLEQYTRKLEGMHKAHESARFSLGVYQLQVQLINEPYSPDDLVRLKWTEWQIAAAKQCMQENNTAAQELLSIEIAGLKNMVETMEASSIFRSAKQNSKANLKHSTESQSTSSISAQRK